jgi:hypothetical protein
MNADQTRKLSIKFRNPVIRIRLLALVDSAKLAIEKAAKNGDFNTDFFLAYDNMIYRDMLVDHLISEGFRVNSLADRSKLEISWNS